MSLNKNVLEDRTLVQLHHLYGEDALKELCNTIYDEMLARINQLKQNGMYQQISGEIDEIVRQALADRSETSSD